MATGEMISAHNLTEYIEPYKTTAYDLCLGMMSQGFYGALFGHSGPLSTTHRNHAEGTGYVLQRPLALRGEKHGRPDNSTWNLDFTIPVQIGVIRGEVAEMTVEEFVSGSVRDLLEERTGGTTEHHVGALSTALRVQYEGRWLESTEREVTKATKAFRGMKPQDITDQKFQASAVDLVLRRANVEALSSDLRDQVRAAHNIARYYPGTADEIIRDRAMLALTRPENEHGHYAWTPDMASRVLWPEPAITDNGVQA